jgi:hypothetical protein
VGIAGDPFLPTVLPGSPNQFGQQPGGPCGRAQVRKPVAIERNAGQGKSSTSRSASFVAGRATWRPVGTEDEAWLGALPETALKWPPSQFLRRNSKITDVDHGYRQKRRSVFGSLNRNSASSVRGSRDF